MSLPDHPPDRQPDRQPDRPPTVAVITSLPRAEALEGQWRELADACEAGPFARPLYALAWWRHLGSGRLAVVTVHEQGRLVALAPLHVRRVGPVSAVRWLGHGIGTVAQALVRPGHEHVGPLLWGAVSGRLRVLDLVECHEAGSLPDGTAPTPRDSCPVIEVRGDAAAHLAAPARKRLRRTVAVARRRLEADGRDLRIEIARDPAALDAVWPAVRRVFDLAEAAYPRLHFLADGLEAFTTEVVREGVARGEMMVLLARADDEPVAFDLVFVSPTSMWSWIGRFDPAAARFSPGHLLQCAGLDWAHAHGRAHIDLLLGPNPYKLQWADTSYRTVEVQVGAPTARRVLAAATRLRALGADTDDDADA